MPLGGSKQTSSFNCNCSILVGINSSISLFQKIHVESIRITTTCKAISMSNWAPYLRKSSGKWDVIEQSLLPSYFATRWHGHITVIWKFYHLKLATKRRDELGTFIRRSSHPHKVSRTVTTYKDGNIPNNANMEPKSVETYTEQSLGNACAHYGVG